MRATGFRSTRVAVDPPNMEGVDAGEWQSLIDRGRQQGSIHAEQVTHVLRHVELTGDVLESVQYTLTEAGISLDETVEGLDETIEVDDTPTAAQRLDCTRDRRGRRAPAQSPQTAPHQAVGAAHRGDDLGRRAHVPA